MDEDPRVHISIHALREEGDRVGRAVVAVEVISIHALREEGDRTPYVSRIRHQNFYPRPPRGGRRYKLILSGTPVQFLSPPSARRATIKRTIQQVRMLHFYPRPPRGGRHAKQCTKRYDHGFLSTPSARRATQALRAEHREQSISIHALREEGDLMMLLSSVSAILFLSTPSARRATAKTETKSLFSNKLYNILHEFRRALIYNRSKNYPNHAK